MVEVACIMIEEVVPNLYRMEIPLPKSPLKWLNSYVVRGGDRFLIIDTGFNQDECRNEMNADLQKLGVDLNKTNIFVTHFHIDHIGLVGTLATENSRVYLNEREACQIDSLRDDWAGHWQKLIDVYVANGFRAKDARMSMQSHPAHKYGLEREVTFSVAKDGDIIEVGDFHFQCVSTPGHSPGHMCLYEPNKKILVAGDHVLSDITPNIAYWLEMDDPLNEYLTNLEKVQALEVKIALPGHRRLIYDVHRRIRELQEHHRDRLNEVLTALRDGPKAAIQIAPAITWDITFKHWEEFPPAQKWFAFGETLAHLRFLENKGKVRREIDNDRISYSLA
jgi:glyoxylase-like metal-dependent hydrolase (beta-lactamase superfamily II)